MTKILSKEAFHKASGFIKENARPIDQAIFALYFEQGSKAEVEKAIKSFQNEDGGFGNCLEPDFRLADSSALATTLAFKILIDAEIDAESEIVKDGVNYLVKSYGENGWEPVPKPIDEVPRAPWWQYAHWANREGPSWLNPNAEVLSVLIHYRSLVPEEILESLQAKVDAIFEAKPEKLEMHDFLATLPLAERTSGEYQEKLYGLLSNHVQNVVAFDEESWGSYGLKPYWVCETPQSPLLTSLGDAAERSLDYEIKNQGEDGSWAPNWAWGQFEDVWPQAKKEWQGQLTVKVLKALKAFGKID